MFFVYIARCSNGAYYVGSTWNVARRIREHNEGRGVRYTAMHGPVRLLWNEPHPTRLSAIRREVQLKGWTRRKKEALIKGDRKLLKRV